MKKYKTEIQSNNNINELPIDYNSKKDLFNRGIQLIEPAKQTLNGY